MVHRCKERRVLTSAVRREVAEMVCARTLRESSGWRIITEASRLVTKRVRSHCYTSGWKGITHPTTPGTTDPPALMDVTTSRKITAGLRKTGMAAPFASSVRLVETLEELATHTETSSRAAISKPHRLRINVMKISVNGRNGGIVWLSMLWQQRSDGQH